jgi:cbb3-type cytochrome oxidase subunit 3
VADSQPLQNLRDIHLPEPVGFWPLAPGWYILAVVLLLLAIGVAYLVYRRHRRGRAKRQALLLLLEYERQYAAGSEASVISAQVSKLLRRVALVYYPRARVAGLNGLPWIRFLNETSNKINFNEISGLILDLPYQNKPSGTDLKPLFSNAKTWIKQRGVPCSN